MITLIDVLLAAMGVDLWIIRSTRLKSPPSVTAVLIGFILSQCDITLLID